jgi:hypothetical protein
MKTPSDELFKLVKSLNPSEKIHFKRFMSRKGQQNHYVKLFDAVNSLNSFDDKKLKKKLKNEPFIKHLPVIKNYTYEAILRSLQDLHPDTSVDLKLQDYIQQAEILVRRKLNAAATKIISKAQKLAIKHEKFHYLVLLNAMELRIIRDNRSSAEVESYIQKKEFNSIKYLKVVNNINQYQNLANRFDRIYLNYSGHMNEDVKKKTHSLLKSPLLSSAEKAVSYNSLQIYYYIHFCAAIMFNKWTNKTCKFQQEWVSYLESKESCLGDRANVYINALGRLMSSKASMGNTMDAEKYYEKAKLFFLTLPSAQRDYKAFAYFTSDYMHYQIIMAHPFKAITAWESIQKSIDLNLLTESSILTLYANLLLSNFMLPDYREALRCSNKIINFKSTSRPDIKTFAQIYSLLIHYELGNYDQLVHFSRSLRKQLLKQGLLHKFEEKMISFFETLTKRTIRKRKKKEVFQQLKNDLKNIFKDPLEASVADNFDWFSWIDSKIRDCSLVDILREKLR